MPTSIKTSCVAVALIAASSLQAQTLLSHYALDGSGTDTGSLGIDGTLINSASYVSGGVGIFEEALSTNSVGSQNFFRADTSDNPAYALSAMTITLWVNISAFGDGDRLVSNVTSNTGFDLYLKTGSLVDGDYRLSFGFNSTSGAAQSSDNSLYQTDEWVFIAVTYDSSVGTNNVLFYVGNESTTVSLNDTGTKTGTIVASTQDLEIGGTPATSGDRTPDALFNDVRIYDGVLNLTQLQDVQASVIPEPSQFAMAIGMLGLAGVILRRRFRNNI